MRPEDVNEWVKRSPFEPFTLEITNGERFTVRHPEQIWVGRSACHLAVFDRDRVLERAVHVALVHVVKIERAVGRNGQRRGTRA